MTDEVTRITAGIEIGWEREGKGREGQAKGGWRASRSRLADNILHEVRSSNTSASKRSPGYIRGCISIKVGAEQRVNIPSHKEVRGEPRGGTRSLHDVGRVRFFFRSVTREDSVGWWVDVGWVIGGWNGGAQEASCGSNHRY